MNEDQKKRLIEDRKSVLETKKSLLDYFDPRFFELSKEDATNVRNTIIVETALSTAALILLDTVNNVIIETLLLLSVSSYLISILLYSYRQKWIVGNSLSDSKKVLDENLLILDDILHLSDSVMSGRISFDDYQKQFASFHQERDVEKGKEQKKTGKEMYFADFGNWLYTAGLIFMVGALAAAFFCQVL